MPALNFLILAGWGAPTFALKAALPAPICGAGLGASVLSCFPLTAPGGISHRWPGASTRMGQHSLLEGAPGAHCPPLSLQNPAGGESPASRHWDLPIACPGPSRAGRLGRFAKGSGAAQTLVGDSLPRCSSIPSTGGQGGCSESQGDAAGPGGSGVGSQCPASHRGALGSAAAIVPPPCKGQAAGERRGVTQTGKLAGTQPFPAGTGKRPAGLCSEPEPG